MLWLKLYSIGVAGVVVDAVQPAHGGLELAGPELGRLSPGLQIPQPAMMTPDLNHRGLICDLRIIVQV